MRRPWRPRLPRRWRGVCSAGAGAGGRLLAAGAGSGRRLRAEEALLPAERRELACEALGRGSGGSISLTPAAVRRLLRLPAADLPALALKLEIAVAEQAWEMSGSQDCLTVIAADARRICETASLWAPENGN